MSPEVLNRLGQSGFTYGKPSGNGIGFHHARQLIERLGGHIQVSSQESLGTEVRISLNRIDLTSPAFPGEEAANWEQIIVVDDDPLVHRAWRDQLSGFAQIHSFFSAIEFKRFYSKNFDRFDRTLVLMDQEFTQEPDANGLDLLIELSLERQAILVTGRYDDPHLVARALGSGIRIYSKVLIPHRLLNTG